MESKPMEKSQPGIVLEVRGLEVALPPGGDRPCAVNGVSFSARAGEILCVVGESGSGKSVAANTVMGLLPRELTVQAGQVRFCGRDVLSLDERTLREMRGREIGMIFQEPMAALNPVMPVGRQITEILEAHGFRAASDNRRRALEALRKVGMKDAERVYDAYPFRLSGGQRQRVMIAMALILEPKLLIADEPTTALDVTTQKQILAEIDVLRREQGLCVLFITHDFGVVSEIADRVVVMEKGEMVEAGPATDVLREPQHPYTRRLIASVPRPGAPRPALIAEPLIRIRDLQKTYTLPGRTMFSHRAFPALDGVSLDLFQGETLGIVGESGSGKSTLAKCLMRLETPEGGTITYRGQDLARLTPRQYRPLRSRIQMVFQDPFSSLNPRRRVGEIIVQGLLAGGLARRDALARARAMLETVQLDASAMDRFPHEFSGGQRQRIGIARALVMEPDVLIADEAVSALDVSVQSQVLDLLKSLQARLGLSMMFITHDLVVAAMICDRVAVMQNGRLVEFGPAGQVLSAPAEPYTRQLIDAIPGRAWIEGWADDGAKQQEDGTLS